MSGEDRYLVAARVEAGLSLRFHALVLYILPKMRKLHFPPSFMIRQLIEGLISKILADEPLSSIIYTSLKPRVQAYIVRPLVRHLAPKSCLSAVCFSHHEIGERFNMMTRPARLSLIYQEIL